MADLSSVVNPDGSAPLADLLAGLRQRLAQGSAQPNPYGDTFTTRVRNIADLVNGKLAQTWPAKLAQSIYGAVTLPGDVAAGRYNLPSGPVSEEDVVNARAGQNDYFNRMNELAGLVMGGGIPAAERGAAGIFGGRLAATADKAALARAEDMAAKGAYPSEIWDATGWFRGMDGKWRFEIPDQASVYKPDALKPKDYTGYGNTITGREGTTGEALQHSELYKAYPDLANIPMAQINYPDGTRAIYHPPGPVTEMIGVDRSIISDPEARSSILHELQHAVQQREGFSTGASPEYYKSNQVPNPARATYEQAQSHPLVQEYHRLHASPEYADELARNNALWTAEYQPRIDALEKNVGRDKWSAVKPQIDGVFAEFKRRADQEFPTMARADEIFATLNKQGIPTRPPSPFLDPREAYRRTAGEVEARNVQSRLEMTPQDLRAIPPQYTQDVPDAQQIVRGPTLGQLLQGR